MVITMAKQRMVHANRLDQKYYYNPTCLPDILAQSACVRHALGYCYYHRSVSLSPSFAFDPLRRISHVRNNFPPNILS